MLDDLTYIHRRDSQDALGQAERQWQGVAEALTTAPAPMVISSGRRPPANIVVVALGDAAVAAEVLAACWPLPVPLQVVRGYDLPAYVAADTLVIGVASPMLPAQQLETVLALAAGREAAVVKLEQHGRFATMPLLLDVAAVLTGAGRLDGPAPRAALVAESAWAARQVAAWGPQVPVVRNPAKQLALELIGKPVLLYASEPNSPLIRYWQAAFHQSAKQLAWTGEFPEFISHELHAWTKQPVSKPFAVVEFIGPDDSPLVQKQAAAAAELLSGQWPAPHIVRLGGDNRLQNLLYGMAFGDMVALYVALASGVDPGPQPLNAKFNRRLEASNE